MPDDPLFVQLPHAPLGGAFSVDSRVLERFRQIQARGFRFAFVGFNDDGLPPHITITSSGDELTPDDRAFLDTHRDTVAQIVWSDEADDENGRPS